MIFNNVYASMKYFIINYITIVTNYYQCASSHVTYKESLLKLLIIISVFFRNCFRQKLHCIL